MQNPNFRISPAKQLKLTKSGAETIAIEVLAFLAKDPARIECFLALSGAGLDNLRAAAAGTLTFGRRPQPSRLRRGLAARLRGAGQAKSGGNRQGAGIIVASIRDTVTMLDLDGTRTNSAKIGGWFTVCARKRKHFTGVLHGLASASTPKPRSRAGARRRPRHGRAKTRSCHAVTAQPQSGLGTQASPRNHPDRRRSHLACFSLRR